VETDPQQVTVHGGGLRRDTVEVTFAVTCSRGAFGTLILTAHTQGLASVPAYRVVMCDFADSYYCSYSDHTSLGDLPPNGTLVARADPGIHRLWLANLPAHCSVRNASPYNPTPPFTVTNGDTLKRTFQVYC
jgi:hypothetical protein